MAKKVLVTQTGSTIRRDKRQLKTLQALGLGRIGKTVEHELSTSVMGMLRTVSHLVVVEEIRK